MADGSRDLASGAAAAPQQLAPPVPQPRRRRLRWSLLLLGPAVILAGAGYLYVTGGRYIGTDNAYVKADKAMVTAEVAGQIASIEVRENQPVAQGTVLFRIDDRRYRIALAEAEASLATVRNQIASLKAGYRQKEAELALARTNLAFAQSEFDRFSQLAASNAVSRSSFDSARHDLDVATQQLRIGEQELAQTQAELGGDPDLPVGRHPRCLEAEAARDRAALELEQTVVRAPIAGIASNTPEPGQQVTGNGALSSPVMSVIADSGIWIEANFKETELTDLRPGQPVEITVDAYPGHRWQGRVQSIGQATGSEFSVIPLQNASGNWVKVVQRIPVRVAVRVDEDGPALRVGMSAVVEVDTGRTRALPGLVAAALAGAGLGPDAAVPAPAGR